MNIIAWMIEQGIAKNEFQASHIANGLRLVDLLHDTEAQQARVQLYRSWRNSGVFPPKDRQSCYAKAINGEVVPELPLERIANAPVTE